MGPEPPRRPDHLLTAAPPGDHRPAAAPDGAPVGDEAFARLLAPFAPFENPPRLALAVSGGADSMALALLAGRWAAARGGRAVALTVDHGLRPESAAEAATVAARCRTLGLAAEVLAWQGPRPETGIEAAARDARYDLLGAACLRHGCLHLLVAHHADDQAETVALRRAMASGAAGLAGMSACVERPGWRLLRPFLGLPRARLASTVAAAELPWVDDPMNRDPRFARARLRRDGGTAALSHGAAADRIAAEARLAAALAACVTLDRFGVARLDRAAWAACDPALRRAILARIALAVGGAGHAPGGVALDNLAGCLETVPAGHAATLGRAIWRLRRKDVVVVREGRHLPVAAPLPPTGGLAWDGRFRLDNPSTVALDIAPLAADGWRLARRWAPAVAESGLPAAAAAALPAAFDLEGLLAVPHFGLVRPGWACAVTVRHLPRHSLAPVPFALGAERATAR